MRFIFAALTAFILLAMFTLFFYQLYEAPFSPTLSAANQKTPIIIYDKDKLHFVNPACDDIKQGISEVLAASQICKTDDECDTGIHLCDIVLNWENHKIYHDLVDSWKRVCGQTHHINCGKAPSSNNYCINQTCKRVSKVDALEEIKKTDATQ